MSQQIQITGGAKVRDLQDVIIGTSGVLSSVAFDVANGVPRLDSNGKILVSQLPNSVMEYKGVWNAATNTPTLANGTGNQGDVYLCNVAGTTNFGAGPIAFVVGDQVIYSSVAEGSIWQRASGATGTVTSVALTESGDSLNITGSPITTSGTINIGFNGTNLQYVNGAGNLTTFPILTGYVPYTGATQDVDLGAFKLNAQSLHIKGTGGLGHLGLKHQSASATSSANESVIFADSLGDLGWQNANLYLSKFITSANNANRSYTFPNATCNIPDDSLVVHLAGTETITGVKNFNIGLTLQTGYYPTPALGYVGLGSNGSGITILTKPVSTVYNNNLQFSAASNTYNFPAASGTIALTSDIPSLAGYVTLATTQTITGAKTFSGAVTLTSSVTTNNLTFANSGFFLTLQPPTLSVNRTVTLPDATGTLALTTDIPSITGLVPYTGATNNVGLGIYSITASTGSFTSYILNDGSILMKNVGKTSTSSGYNTFYSLASGFGFGFADFAGNDSIFTFSATGDYTYTFPAASGTIALVGGSGVGTVTSVAALTIGTSGTDLSSTVANSTTTPVITLNVPTASATNRGALSSADWTTFNNKQGTITLTTTGTSGAATFVGNTLNIPNYAPDLSGYVTLATTQTISGAKTFSSTLTAQSNIDLTGDLRYQSNVGYGLKSANGTRLFEVYNTGVSFVTALSGTSASFISTAKVLEVKQSAAGSATYYVFDNTVETTGKKWRFGYTGAVADAGTFSLYNETDNVVNFVAKGGNLGLGVTPSAWNSGYKAIQNNSTSWFSTISRDANFGTNVFVNSGGNYAYIETAVASLYTQFNGVHIWQTAPSGTAGAAISFTQAMTLTASGRLLINTPTESTYQLDVNGTGRFSGQVRFGTGLYIENNGDFYQPFTGQIQISGVAGNTTYPSYGFYGNTGLGMYRESANVLAFVTSGVKALTIASTGAATFSSTITSNDTYGFTIGSIAGAKRIQYGSDAATAFSFLTATNSYAGIYAGAATFSSSVTAVGTMFLQRASAGASTTLQFKNEAAANRAKILFGGTNEELGFYAGDGSVANLTITSSGNVLIGTTTDNAGKLQVNGEIRMYGSTLFRGMSSNTLQLCGGTSSSNVKIDGSVEVVTIDTNGAERLRITSGGNVGIGTSSPLYKTHIANAGANAFIGISNQGASNGDRQLIMGFGGNGSETFATIKGTRYNVADDVNIAILGGNVLIGDTTDYSYKLYVNGGSSNGMLFYSTSAANQIKAAGTAPAITFSNTITSATIGGSLGACTSANQFLTGTAAGDMILINQFTGNKLYITNYSGGVYLTQGATSWTANSDIRLKNINSYIENAVEKLSTLQTINFSYKDDKANKQNLGLIAQEVEKIFPELIDKNGDGMLGVRYTELVPVLIKAVQELKLEIETLKNK